MNSQFEVVMATDGDEGSNAELTFVADSMGKGVWVWVMTCVCRGCWVYGCRDVGMECVGICTLCSECTIQGCN